MEKNPIHGRCSFHSCIYCFSGTAALGGGRLTPIPAWTVTQVHLAPEILKRHERGHPEGPGGHPRLRVLVSASLLGVFSFRVSRKGSAEWMGCILLFMALGKVSLSAQLQSSRRAGTPRLAAWALLSIPTVCATHTRMHTCAHAHTVEH